MEEWSTHTHLSSLPLSTKEEKTTVRTQVDTATFETLIAVRRRDDERIIFLSPFMEDDEII